MDDGWEIKWKRPSGKCLKIESDTADGAVVEFDGQRASFHMPSGTIDSRDTEIARLLDENKRLRSDLGYTEQKREENKFQAHHYLEEIGRLRSELRRLRLMEEGMSHRVRIEEAAQRLKASYPETHKMEWEDGEVDWWSHLDDLFDLLLDEDDE